MCFLCSKIKNIRKEEKMICIRNILICFPIKISKKIEDFFLSENINLNLLEEIRIRINRPILLKIGYEERKIEHIITSDEILETLQHICDNSIYSYQSQICNRIYNNARRTSCWNNRKCNNKRRKS